MKNIFKVAALAVCGMIFANSTMAQSDVTTEVKLLQAKANDVNAKLKAQAAKLNKNYNEVDPFIEEQMNDREDSIYLKLLSEKRLYELQIAEIKKAEKIKAAKESSSEISGKSQTSTTTPIIKTTTGTRKAKKLKVTK